MAGTIHRLAIAASMLWLIGHKPTLAQQLPEERGEVLVIQHCAMCHAIGRNETSPNPMARPFRTIGRSTPVEALEEPLRNGALFGHPMMPKFALTFEDAHAIVQYLRSIQTP